MNEKEAVELFLAMIDGVPAHASLPTVSRELNVLPEMVFRFGSKAGVKPSMILDGQVFFANADIRKIKVAMDAEYDFTKQKARAN